MVRKRFTTRGNPALYEINTVAWLYELSNRLGRPITIAEVPSEEWQRLSKLGIELVWLMGIWRRSHAGRKIALNEPELRKVYDSALPGWSQDDIIGSSYSISAYEPDPAVGTREDLSAAHEALHRHGMGLLLDFIPNHTGTDFPWVKEHPEYYVQGTEADYLKDRAAFTTIRRKGKTLYLARGRDPYFAPWTDTLQLDYFNPEMRAAILHELEIIAEHCDGVRCDMAMLVLNDIFQKTWGWAKPAHYEPPREFWAQALEYAPDLIWIAEAYWDTEHIFHQLGFDYVYDKKLYDLLRWSPVQDVRDYLKMNAGFQERMLRFMENHDEIRAVTAFGKDRLTALATLFCTLPGMKLYHHGQLEGKRVGLPLQLRRVMKEAPDPEVRALYERLLEITRQDIFHHGSWELKEVMPAWGDSFRNLIAFMWRLGKHSKLVVVNLSPDYSQGRIAMEDAEDRSYRLVDELNQQSYIREGKEMAHPGLHVLLDGYRAHIFDVE